MAVLLTEKMLGQCPMCGEYFISGRGKGYRGCLMCGKKCRMDLRDIGVSGAGMKSRMGKSSGLENWAGI